MRFGWIWAGHGGSNSFSNNRSSSQLHANPWFSYCMEQLLPIVGIEPGPNKDRHPDRILLSDCSIRQATWIKMDGALCGRATRELDSRSGHLFWARKCACARSWCDGSSAKINWNSSIFYLAFLICRCASEHPMLEAKASQLSLNMCVRALVARATWSAPSNFNSSNRSSALNSSVFNRSFTIRATWQNVLAALTLSNCSTTRRVWSPGMTWNISSCRASHAYSLEKSSRRSRSNSLSHISWVRTPPRSLCCGTSKDLSWNHVIQKDENLPRKVATLTDKKKESIITSHNTNRIQIIKIVKTIC